jgi:hypothetical protein
MEFTDLASYTRLEAQEEKELTAGLNRAQQRRYLPTNSWSYFENILNDKQNRWKYAVFSKLFLNSREFLTR